MPRNSVCVLPAQYAPGPPAVGYDPIKSVEWALGSVQQQGERPQRGKQPYPWEPQVASDPQDALPVWGVKQTVNSPLDFGPYKREGAELSTVSWPGQRAAPSPQEVVTLFVNDLNGAKVPIACRMGDTVESLRKQKELNDRFFPQTELTRSERIAKLANVVGLEMPESIKD